MRSLSSSESNDDTTILRRIRHRKRVPRQETPEPTRATRRRLVSSDEEAEQRTTFQYIGVTYTHPRFMPFVEDTNALYIDIDSLWIAVSAPDLLHIFPIYSLAQLSSTRHLHRQLKQYTHVGTAVGYQMYVKTLPFATKQSVCEYISRIGPLVHPSKKIGVFFTGKIVCPSGLLLEALIASSITTLVLEAYGQKAPLHTVQLLANIQVQDPLLQVRVDIGINGSCTGIPLFLTSSGRTYLMLLYLAGSRYGSTTTNLQSLCGHHRVIVYPQLVHHTKAYFHTSIQRPATNKALKKKRKYMETAVTDLIATNDLTGYTELRNHIQMKEWAELATSTGEPHYGVKGNCILSDYLEIPECIPIDYMHLTLEGVFKQLMRQWFDQKHHSQPFSLRKYVRDIDKLVLSIKPANEIQRLPQSLDSLSFFKASEYRAWLLIYALPVLSNFLPPEYVHHLSLLVASFHILLSDEIRRDELELVHQMLATFISYLENYIH